MESGFDTTPRQARLYAADIELLKRKVRSEQLRRQRDVSIAEIVHEQLAQLRLDERAEHRERGRNE